MSTQHVVTSPGRAPALTAFAAAGALAADVIFDPLHRHVALCPFHDATGLWCPLCGGLRAAQSLAELHIRAALQDNILFVASLPLIVIAWFGWLARSRAGRPSAGPSRTAVVAIVSVLVAFMIVRNLPFASALRPS